MRILVTEAVEQHRALVRLVVAPGGFEENQVRRFADENAAVAHRKAGSQVQALRKGRDLVRNAVAVGVFVDANAVRALAANGALGRIL